MLLDCHRLYLNHIQGDFTLAELSTDCLESCRTIYWLLLNCHRLWLKRMQGDHTLAELFTGCLESRWMVTGSSWIVCRVILLQLNCVLRNLTLIEPCYLIVAKAVFLLTILLEYFRNALYIRSRAAPSRLVGKSWNMLANYFVSKRHHS